jgi:hypothetical protein
MALKWETIRPEHVHRACELLSSTSKPSKKEAGLFVTHEGHRLPAKRVVAIAYCLANNLSIETKLKFASGDSTLRVLQGLGFDATRVKGQIASQSPIE